MHSTNLTKASFASSARETETWSFTATGDESQSVEMVEMTWYERYGRFERLGISRVHAQNAVKLSSLSDLGSGRHDGGSSSCLFQSQAGPREHQGKHTQAKQQQGQQRGLGFNVRHLRPRQNCPKWLDRMFSSLTFRRQDQPRSSILEYGARMCKKIPRAGCCVAAAW